MIEIKRLGGTTILAFDEVPEGALVHRELMADHYAKFVFSLAEPVYLRLGDYVELADFGRFELTEPYSPKYNSETAGYDYTLQLDAYYMKWKNKKVRYIPAANASETSFNLTAAIGVHLDVIVKGINALGQKDANFKYNGVTNFRYELKNFPADKVNTAKHKQYQNTDFISALNDLAKIFECEWWVEANTIFFGKCKIDGEEIDFELDENVEEMSGSQSKNEYATRIIAFGSQRNLPPDYRKNESADVTVNGVIQKRLMLPLTRCPYGYVQDANIASETEAIEAIVVDEDIYPRTKCVVSKVETYTDTQTDEDTGEEVTRTFYRLYDGSGFNFSSDYILEGETLHILFQSGAMNGMDFECQYNDEKKYYEVVLNEDYGRPLPDENLHPSKDDEFVLYGWDSTKIGDTGLVDAAEEELYQAVLAKLQDMKIDQNTYNCTMKSDWYAGKMETDNLKTYTMGQPVRLINPTYFANGRSSRIIGYEVKLDFIYDNPVYIVGEAPAYSRAKSVQEQIDSLTFNGVSYSGGGNGGSGSGVYIITTTSTTPSSDSNVYSAARSDKQFLRRDVDDVTKHHLTMAGIKVAGDATISGNTEVGDSVQSSDYINSNFPLGQGWRATNDNGNGDSTLEVDKLFVRTKAVFAELEIRKMSYIGGNYVFSSGGGKIYYVEWLDANGEILEQTEANKSLIDTFRCYLYSDDGTTQTMNWFRVDDQVRCQNFGDLTESKTVKTANGVITDADHTTHYWWRRVNATGKGVIAAKGDNKEYEYIDFQNTVGQYGADSDFPEIGDAMVQLGNWVNEDRQAAIMIVVVGDTAPAIIEWQKIGAGGKHFVMPDEAYSRLSPRQGVGNILRGKFISITDSNKDKSIDEQLNVLLDQLTDIKNQADKKFDIWFNSGAPRPNSATDTATSLPSSDWATDAEKALHVQDLYYDTDKSPASQGGRAWRWMSHNVDNSTIYYWEEVTDQDTIDALERNAALQKQVDNNTLRERLANLGEVVYELSHEELKTKKDGSGIKIYLNTEAEPATTILNKGDFVYYNAIAKKYDGNALIKLTDNVQTQAFTLAAEIIDSEVITCYNAVPQDATKNAMCDLLLIVASFDDGMGNKFDGKLSISMWNGENWEALRNGSTAIMENLGNAIVNAVFSANEDGTTGSAGFVSKAGLSKLFAKSGSSEASVDALLSFDKDGTPKATTKIKGDNIILEGAVTANMDFYIDTWGNVMTGVDVIFSSEALGDNTFIIENKSNILVQKTCTIVLPNDREYIGRRIMLITEKPATNVGGVGSNLDDFPTIKICTGRVCVNRIYAYDASTSGSAGTYRVLYDPSDCDSTKTPWAGVRYLSGLPTMLLNGSYYYPQGVSVTNGYIELLGVGVDANNLYETKDSDKLTAIGYNADSTSELLAHTLNLGRDTEDKTIIQSAANKGTITTDATTGSASEWQSVGKICRWVVINVRGQLVREYSDFDLSIGVDI